MELLEGETLAERLEKEKKMSADKAISMLLPVMESLRQVNAQGIIHRDIAPDNIYITKQNEIKLIDFGAAREYKPENRYRCCRGERCYHPCRKAGEYPHIRVYPASGKASHSRLRKSREKAGHHDGNHLPRTKGSAKAR